jgi:hypothetical protein
MICVLEALKTRHGHQRLGSAHERVQNIQRLIVDMSSMVCHGGP